jgi:hypothetical protein
MSDKPKMTALQIWILQAQREILLKGSFTCAETSRSPESQAA